jgi:hypothetical protein
MSSADRELKRISLQFRNLASRALRSDDADARVNLRRLLAYVRETSLLAEEIARAPVPTIDVMELWNRTRNSGDKLELPDDPLEELGLLHALLTQFSKPSKEEFWTLCYRYGNVSGLKESLSEVLHDVCGKYEAHLRNVIEMALLDSNDPAYDSRRVDIHLSGGTNQVNVAQDGAQVHATQAVTAEVAEMIRLAREVSSAVGRARQVGTPPELEEIGEAATAVAVELARPTPSRFTLRSAKEKLEILATSANALGTIGTQVHSLVTYLNDWFHRVAR